jgi:DNA polymerase I-like protein with 3'-5' exonuclease and polymerase domains
VQVHDELLFEVRGGHVAAAAALVQRAMEDAAAVWALKVALPVKVSVGSSWGQLQEYVVQ